MPSFHHQPLPNYSTLLMGHTPPEVVGCTSERLQIWYNHTHEAWHDPLPHAHAESDECFIVLQGRLVVEVDGQQITIGPREFCCFPRGVVHAIVETYPPIESLMIRAPSINDKIYIGGESGKND
jgi:mannose-6-phosphate isomerase-like protein (cupin superfamily)